MVIKKHTVTTVGDWRLFNPATGDYLGLSGKHDVTGDAYAWRGTKEQSENLRKSGGFSPSNWPYALVRAVGFIWGQEPMEVVK